MPCIIGDAILPQTGENWPKTRSGIWRFAVAPSDATSKNRNIGAQLQFLTCIKPQSCFGKFTSCMSFGAHKLVHSDPFLDYRYKVWQLLSALRSVMRKNIYIAALLHIYIPGAKMLQWNFLKISQLSIRSGAHKLYPRFLDFSQFLTAISRKLWRHLVTNMRTV